MTSVKGETIGFIGLGTMGKGSIRRFLQAGINVIGYDISPENSKAAAKDGCTIAGSIQELISKVPKPRKIWLLVPLGKPVDDTLFDPQTGLINYCEPEDIIIEGGNSFFRDSIRRGEQLKEQGIIYMDCGTSGGVEGGKYGYCLMVGGEKHAYDILEPFLSILASDRGLAYIGPSGAGHFLKMVHIGIISGILESIGEGFELIESGCGGLYPDLDLAEIAELWCHGSIMRSYMMEILARAFRKDPNLESITGHSGGEPTGSWPIEEGWKAGVPMPAIAVSYAMRLRSYQPDTFAGKVCAALRWEYGRLPAKSSKEGEVPALMQDAE